MSARREQILDAARDLIVREGYASASMHAIARASGVTRPALYAEFGDREALLAALMDREEERVLDMAAASMPEVALGADLTDIAEQSVDVYLDLVESAPQSWQFVLMPVEGFPVDTQERVERGRAAIRERSEFMFRALGAVAERDIDAELLSHAAIAISETAGRLVLDPSYGDQREAVSKTLRWLARRAVSTALAGKQE